MSNQDITTSDSPSLNLTSVDANSKEFKTFTEHRPWGNFLQLTHNEPSTVKILTVLAHQQTSLQYHAQRTENWTVLQGTGTIQIGEETMDAKAGDTHTVPTGVQHRISGGDTDLVILEVSTGNFDESDITRVEDAYGRVAKKSHANII